jgi:hypothetical protein
LAKYPIALINCESITVSLALTCVITVNSCDILNTRHAIRTRPNRFNGLSVKEEIPVSFFIKGSRAFNKFTLAEC